MKEATVTIQGVAPLSMSRVIPPDEEAKLRKEGESHADYDKRCWSEKAHYAGKDSQCFIPSMAIKMHLDWTAGQLGMKIQGRGLKQWKSLFAAGIMCFEDMQLFTNAGENGEPVTKDALDYVDVFCDAQGRKGSSGGGRVWRRFPVIHDWAGTVTFTVLDDQITESIFKQHLTAAGKICGLGRWRAGVGGQYGRYQVVDFSWEDMASAIAA